MAHTVKGMLLMRAFIPLQPYQVPPMLAVVCETPSNWFNEKGTSSKDSEAVQKLYWQVGALCSALSSLETVSLIYVTTPRWKGQIPKDVMVRRAIECCKQHSLTLSPKVPHDTAEAILLAKYVGISWMTNGSSRDPLPPNLAKVYDARYTATDSRYQMQLETFFSTSYP